MRNKDYVVKVDVNETDETVLSANCEDCAASSGWFKTFANLLVPFMGIFKTTSNLLYQSMHKLQAVCHCGYRAIEQCGTFDCFIRNCLTVAATYRPQP